MRPARLLPAAALALLALACSHPDSGPPDTVKPHIRFVFPLAGDTLAPDTYTLVAVATDDRGLDEVVFWRDTAMLGFLPPAPADTYRCGWDCRADSGVWRILGAEARDAAGNDTGDVIRVYVRPAR